MNPVRHIHRVAAVLAATPAFARPEPYPGAGYVAPASVPAQVPYRTIVVGGMPGWQIALIAVGAALLAATMAVLADRVRAARRPAVPTAPEPCTQFTRCRRPPVLAGGTAAGRLGPTPE